MCLFMKKFSKEFEPKSTKKVGKEAEPKCYTVNSVIEDCLLFNFGTFGAVLYSFLLNKSPIFPVFYSKQAFIQNSLRLQSLRYMVQTAIKNLFS